MNTNTIRAAIRGAQLAELRKEIGMTQDAFGDAIGLSRVTVGKMERGQAIVDLRTWCAARYIYVTRVRMSA